VGTEFLLTKSCQLTHASANDDLISANQMMVIGANIPKATFYLNLRIVNACGKKIVRVC